MQYPTPLLPGRAIRRYKRFFADVQLETGETVTAHCPNTGSMRDSWHPGWRVAISPANNPDRKLKYTLELVHNGRCWISVHTGRTNAVAAEGIAANRIPELAGYDQILREKPYGESSRIDLLLTAPTRPDCYVEIKSVTMVMQDGCYAFPDSVTSRGLKHLRELTTMVEQGHRAVMLYLIQRRDGTTFRLAHEIDPEYATGLRQATKAGVECLAYRMHITKRGLSIAQKIPLA